MDYYSVQDTKEYDNFLLKLAKNISEIQEEYNKLSPQNKMCAQQAAYGAYLSLTAYKRF